MSLSTIRGLYPIIDTIACQHAGIRSEVLAEGLAGAGVSIAQFRHKGPFTREVFHQAEAVSRILQPAGVRYILDDRADIALTLDAGGVHLGQDGLPRSKIRVMVGSSRWIGYSTHNRGQLQAGDREPVDYLAIGPIFPTGSKERPDPVLGPAALAELRALTRKPLVAIGGITRSNARSVLDAGADA